MNTFAQAVNAPAVTETTNGMKAFTNTGKSIVDLFYSIGSSRNAQPKIAAEFSRAFAEDKTLAARTLFWARDIRGGAGERLTFRNLMLQLEKTDVNACKRLIPLIPEYGRWDDLLIFTAADTKEVAYKIISKTLKNGIKSRHILEIIESLSEDDCKELLEHFE